jgi:hypothetical protein
MKNKPLKRWHLPLVFSLLVFASCQHYFFRTTYDSANEMLNRSKETKTKPFLKAHFKSGEVVIFENDWEMDASQQFIIGQGTHYDVYRKTPTYGPQKVNISMVSLFETNERLKNPELGRIGSLTVIGAADLAVGIFCNINPKP